MGIHIMRNIVCWGLCWGPLILGNYDLIVTSAVVLPLFGLLYFRDTQGGYHSQVRNDNPSIVLGITSMSTKAIDHRKPEAL